MNLEKKVGAFEVGLEWDAQLVQLSTVAPLPSPPTSSLPSSSSPSPHSMTQSPGAGEGIWGGVDMGMDTGDEGLVELWGNETWSEKVAKWLFCGDDRNTRRVYVRGRLVYERR